MNDTVIILCKTIINVFSVILHITLLLTIACTPSLKCGGFDELFFSQNVGDVVAVILRVITKYSPVLILRNHSGVIQVDKETLASVLSSAASQMMIASVFLFLQRLFEPVNQCFVG
ncbi:hypothetical protein ANCCAN_04256 [Ancylostoma caninum]|uniref:Uncharacterized protein n=1 Tax=Ancylostoma caninum TaxID=29170 RepID=A0A368GZ51_ANCCA|nr:hypothetical protein ANCCAN_04256 [Ancylostoma caninum]